MSRVWSKAAFARMTHPLFATGALFILDYGALQPVKGIAQSVFGTQTQSAWIKLCFDAPHARSNAESGSTKPPSASEIVEACFTYMEERDEQTGILMHIIGVLNAEALHQTVLVAFLPLGEVHAPEAGDLVFPNAAPIKFSYLRSQEACDGSGCYARAELSQSQLEEIKAAQVITVSFGNGLQGGSIRTPRACCRFAEAFAGAPVPASGYDETRRRIVETLQRKFTDFIQ